MELLTWRVSFFVIYPKKYDVLVIGSGHAGIEAAFASARLGACTAMLTQNLDTIGQMSCNPAIGGIGKGHMVREIDAMGGAMGENTDATAVQFRLLNRKKGPSVRAPRAQCDKKAYQFRMKWLAEQLPNLQLHQASVVKILVKDHVVFGVQTALGVEFHANAIVLSSGTFMGGLMHVGMKNQRGGRMGEGASTLSDSLADLGFSLARFKTGTPCRLNGRSIDFSLCEAQYGDDPPPRFAYSHEKTIKGDDEIFTLNRWGDPLFHMEQLPCWITYTNEKTHELIRDNLDQSPMFAGVIEGTGPRYCPSIEDKVVRFSEKSRHQVFLEPEGRQTNEYYVNGLSTSLPFDVQIKFIQSISGLENAEIIRPGYAVEYDYCPPTQLQHTLETKKIENLYFAGQINGTSGYEEAAGQGLVAGANAALKVSHRPPFLLSRSDSYIGVMIDDLVSKGTVEPYRMFTSRAEYRLFLRQDNADIRLSPLAAEAGLISSSRMLHVEDKMRKLAEIAELGRKTNHQGLKLDQWFRQSPNNIWQMLAPDLLRGYPDEVWELAETEFKYEGYLRQQENLIAKHRKNEVRKIPQGVDYSAIVGMKKEAQLRLADAQPQTLGQAGRLSGITPADIGVLSVWLEKESRKQ